MDGYFTTELLYRPPARPARTHARRAQKRRGRLFARAAAVCCLCAAMLYGAAQFPGLLKSAARAGAGVISGMMPADLGGAWSDETRAAVTALAATHPEAQAMLDAPERWPEDVAGMLARSEEPLDFVLAYPDLRDAAPTDTVTEAEKGVFPSLRQWDARWGCAVYGGSILALSGCGPTALSVAVCGLLGDETATPGAIAAWAQLCGYAGSYGTSWDMMREGCEHFGLRSEELPLSESSVRTALAAGKPIICAMRAGDFTTQGHFIVLTGMEDELLRVVDPNSAVRSDTLWSYDRLEPQIKALWAYEAA